MGELQNHGFTAKHPFVAIRGEVFDLGRIAKVHQPAVVSMQAILKYAGRDASSLFPQQLSALCNGVDGSVSPWLTLSSSNASDTNAIYHDFRYSTSLLDVRPDWYEEKMIYMRYRYRVGMMGWTTGDVAKRASTTNTRNTAIIDSMVFDLTQYVTNNDGGIALSPNGTRPPDGIDTHFMSDNIVELFKSSSGSDITKQFYALRMKSNLRKAQQVCLRNIFYIGKVDTRGSPQCLFSRYILLALSIFIVCIVGFKFLAALSFGATKMAPSDAEKFVILQLPCYTEGEESLRKSIESLAATKYDDKRKLLCVICDGNVTGAGNEKPTPQLVLNILGSDPSLDPEPLSYIALGEGARQHNLGRIYSGLYEHRGHVVPYLVIVKVGKPTERSRPGNRGKRDSQVLLMRWLNKVHFNTAMAPVELEIYHHVKNVIGVNPAHYEFLFSIDADTEVAPDSLSKMVAGMLRDRRVIALCGETSISNSRKSLVTSLQVFEYFVSHHLAKAFESFFGTVTCLPGCFSLFRIKTLEQKPLLCSNPIIDGFSLNVVDTLHLKNLLHLGEDRYLTTLLLKNFPTYKTAFIKDATALTAAPESWKVLLSQRRRWINSTVHNLFELVLVDQLCGMCCFSMRFVVLIDLVSTLVSPVTVAYIGYLFYLIISQGAQFPLTAIIMLAAVYGLQAIIFIIRGRFEMVGWLVIYILAIPIFSFLIPLYAFWHMDSFSWGSTRILKGEKGKRMVVHEEGRFDPDEIPMRTWAEYEEDLWERGSNQSIGSIIEHGKRPGHGENQSLYGDWRDSPQQSPAESRAGTPYSYSRARSPGLISPYPTRPAPYSSPALMEMTGSGDFGFPFKNPSPRPSVSAGMALPSYPSSSPTLHQFHPSPQPLIRAPFGTMPSDEQIAQDVVTLVANADLNIVTKKDIRTQLSRMYGISDLGVKTMSTNKFIDEAVDRRML